MSSISDPNETGKEGVARHYCGQRQPHAAHAWTTPPAYGSATVVSTYQCAGLTAEIPPGPCWHDSGVKWSNEMATIRCDLLAGHAGAHQAERPMGGTSVWLEAAERPTGRDA